MEAVFRLMDADGSGQLSLGEFRKACDVLNECSAGNEHHRTPPPQKPRAIARSGRRGRDGGRGRETARLRGRRENRKEREQRERGRKARPSEKESGWDESERASERASARSGG